MLLDGDGFDHYGGNITNTLLGVHGANTGCSLSTTRVRTGTHSLYMPGPGFSTTPGFRRVVPSGLRTVLNVGFGFYMDDLPVHSDNFGIKFLDVNANPISSFNLLTDGRVNVRRGSHSGTQLGMSVLPILNATAWNFVEFRLGMSATVGITGMRVNNVEVDGLMLDGLNTDGQGGNLISQYYIGSYDANFGAMNSYLDDLIVWDSLGDDNNDWIGDQQLLWRPPTADFGGIEFIPSTGASLWDLIDESNPSAADYIRALSADKQAAFEFDDVPEDIGEIAGIIPYIFGKKLNPGTCTVNMGMLTDGFVGDAIFTATTPDLQMTTVDTFWRGVLERNPATDLPYEPAEVNGSYLYLDRTA